jgi:tRNA pseudouridine32 synthase/23S rRNA pseudouridine746 synthase
VLAFLYHDDALIALAKPAGRIVVPGRGAARDEPCLRDDVAAELGRSIYVVHRLDRGTSGVLLFALTADAHRALSIAFERHLVDKRYWGLAQGILLGTGLIDRPLIPIRGGKVRVALTGETGGKPSSTAWRALERFGEQTPGAGPGAAGFTALEIRPRSGRLHQVRAHLASIGHPLAVDPDYGGAEQLAFGQGVALTRVPLHAASLRLKHPTTGQPLEIAAPLPEDLERTVAALRASSR